MAVTDSVGNQAFTGRGGPAGFNPAQTLNSAQELIDSVKFVGDFPGSISDGDGLGGDKLSKLIVLHSLLG